MGYDIQVTGLDRVVADFEREKTALLPKVRAVASKGALNVKNRMNSDFRDSLWFKGVAGSVNYDINVRGSVVEAVIGPDKSKFGGRGALANIAYFGGSHGGGGTVDVTAGLKEEEPRLVDNLQRVLGDV